MTIAEKIKQHLRITGYVLTSSFNNEKSFKDAVSRLRKEGYELKRVKEFGKDVGYKLTNNPNDRQ